MGLAYHTLGKSRIHKLSLRSLPMLSEVISHQSRMLMLNQGGEPEPGKSNTIRTVVYAACAPAKLASEEAIAEKRKVFELNGATTHWPHDNIKLRDLQARLPDGTLDPRHRVQPLEQAERTEQLLRLAGVMAY